MFAQTRFSLNISAGQNNHGYYGQAPAYNAAPVYQQGYDTRYQAPQSYNDAYAHQGVSRGYAENQDRDFDRDDRNDNRGRAFHDRDDDDRDRSCGHSQNYRQANGYSNRFTNH